MKQKFGSSNLLYPLPVTIVGAIVEGKPNFINISHVGILADNPISLISLSMSKTHYTNQGIKENQTFSVNIPSEEMVVEADYVGLVSGSKTDKSNLFEIVYGELETAPMIKDCPISIECRLYQTLETSSHDNFLGEVVATYVDEAVMTNGKADIAKVKPLLFDMSSRKYWTLGSSIADCWAVGKQFK